MLRSTRFARSLGGAGFLGAQGLVEARGQNVVGVLTLGPFTEEFEAAFASSLGIEIDEMRRLRSKTRLIIKNPGLPVNRLAKNFSTRAPRGGRATPSNVESGP